MTEQTIYIETGQEKIVNLDADEYGNFIAFTDNKTVITNDINLKIDIELSFPIIRRLNAGTFFITDGRTDKSDNGHIYSFSGQKLRSFLAGDGIEDIIIHNDKIVITYFDEGVYGDDGPNNDGVSVFDFSGNQLFGFNSNGSYGHIVDCYCICKHDNNKVLFYAYTELKVYELNLDTYKIVVYDTPNEFSGTASISSKQDKIYFHSSYDDKQSFFLWDRKKNVVTKFGSYISNLTGIGNGKFIMYGVNGYTIIDPTE